MGKLVNETAVYTRWLRFGCLAVLCIVTVGCGDREEAALRTFSEAYSCPRDRMTVNPVKDVTMRDLWLRANPMPQPPDDVQADQARLAVWMKAQEERREGPLRGVKRYSLFHVSGCNHSVDYACFCAPHTKGSTTARGTRQNSCGCQPPPAPVDAIPDGS